MEDRTEKRIRQARFWKKYLRMTRVGVPTLRTVELACEEEADPAFKEILFRIREGLEAGHPLSEMAGMFPAEFSPCTIEMIKTAEKRGAWEAILIELSEGLKDGTFD